MHAVYTKQSSVDDDEDIVDSRVPVSQMRVRKQKKQTLRAKDISLPFVEDQHGAQKQSKTSRGSSLSSKSSTDVNSSEYPMSPRRSGLNRKGSRASIESPPLPMGQYDDAHSPSKRPGFNRRGSHSSMESAPLTIGGQQSTGRASRRGSQTQTSTESAQSARRQQEVYSPEKLPKKASITSPGTPRTPSTRSSDRSGVSHSSRDTNPQTPAFSQKQSPRDRPARRRNSQSDDGRGANSRPPIPHSPGKRRKPKISLGNAPFTPRGRTISVRTFESFETMDTPRILYATNSKQSLTRALKAREQLGGIMMQTGGGLIVDSDNNLASEDQVKAPSTPNGSKITKLYEHARNCEWDEVLEECEKHPRDAKCVGEKDGTTACHLAVMSRVNPLMRDGELGEYDKAPLEVIEELLKACPEAAITRCTVKRYTPLGYACLVSDRGYDMDDAAELVELILHHAPESAYVFTDDGFSALDIHILSYSRFHKEKEEVYSGGRTSTVVVRTLLAEKPFLADARIYKNKIRGPLELLYRCNLQEFKDALEEGGDDLNAVQISQRRQKRFSSVTSTLSDWWAWKWALLILKFATLPKRKPGTIFSAVHAASQLVGCPQPILSLATITFPKQVSERDPYDDLYNLPLHMVCSWKCDQEIICGDPFVLSRKKKAIDCLLEEFPEAARMTNNMGETPLELAIESCTPWHGGLEDLVKACPKALKFPKKLRRKDDAGRYQLSVPTTSALASVCSVNSDTDDPVSLTEGMYPFLIAAVVSKVSDSRRNNPSCFHFDQTVEEHQANLDKKDLQSVRTIYGLLRTKPSILQQFRDDVDQ